MLRNLATNGILDTNASGLYQMTHYTSALAEPRMASMASYFYEMLTRLCAHLPSFLAATDYQNPSNFHDGVWNHMTGQDCIDYLRTHPGLDLHLSNKLSLLADSREDWLEVFPPQSLLSRSNSQSVLLVDVGGNTGNDIANFQSRHPQAPGRLVLQDRAEQLERGTTLDSAIQKMPHDFFQEQPVKGAAAYYMHTVLHDWPDDEARKILECLKPAMFRGYSRLLINESVITTRPKPLTTTSDITMMLMASAWERTEDMWRHLLGSSGFRVLKIWSSPHARESVIEAELE